MARNELSKVPLYKFVRQRPLIAGSQVRNLEIDGTEKQNRFPQERRQPTEMSCERIGTARLQDKCSIRHPPEGNPRDKPNERHA